jgi:hypothetical protein
LSEIEKQVKGLIAAGQIRISEHGYDELADDKLTARELVSGARDAELLEEYPDYPKGPSVLFLQRDSEGSPVHAVWGVPKGHSGPAVLVTAYRPHPDRWDTACRRRI